MKSRFILIFTALSALSACQERSTTPASSFIHQVIDTLNIDKKKNVLIYTINPNDCLNCINGFKDMSRDLAAAGNGRVFVISVERAIEKNTWEKQITDIDLSPEPNKAVLWSKDIFYRINHEDKGGLGLTQVTIYNYDRDTILFSRPVREISDDSPLKALLSKQL
ncbi:MAG: hypothetical protein ACJ77K_12490 [Bacteroidia bacterium]